jgi:UDP-GlcNAc3NAcA epimerase
MKKILTVVGARPQFVKAAVVSRALVAAGGSTEVIVHTGQHFDAAMSDVFFEEMGIPEPSHHLGIGGMGHGAMTGRMLEALEGVMQAERPDWVLVYGDTNSTLAGALAAVKLHLPVAHVEAGLRSFNRRMPEEINRVLTDHAASLLFAPTQTAVDNLRGEGIADAMVVRSGDVMYDAALQFAQAAEAKSSILSRIGAERGRYVLATIHRAENTDALERLTAIIDGLLAIGRRTPVVLPLHPRTRVALERAGRLGAAQAGLTLIDPVGYVDMVMLERHATLIATDSGGVQKEAYFYDVPCVTLRDETEWTELLACGANRLAPPVSADTVARALAKALDGGRGPFTPGLYGAGDAGALIARRLTM